MIRLMVCTALVAPIQRVKSLLFDATCRTGFRPMGRADNGVYAASRIVFYLLQDTSLRTRDLGGKPARLAPQCWRRWCARSRPSRHRSISKSTLSSRATRRTSQPTSSPLPWPSKTSLLSGRWAKQPRIGPSCLLKAALPRLGMYWMTATNVQHRDKSLASAAGSVAGRDTRHSGHSRVPGGGSSRRDQAG